MYLMDIHMLAPCHNFSSDLNQLLGLLGTT